MTQTIFRWLSLLILLTFVTVLPAAAEEGQIYTIKKGDTLWGLSQRFIDDPYYWPNVWSHNPDITNPHLIFPGQKIRILDGRLEIIPAYPEAETSTPDAEEPAATETAEVPAEEIIIPSAGGGDGFILTTEESLGTLVDSVDNRVLLTENDTVFVKMKDPGSVTVGDTYGLFAREDLIKHPKTKKKVGHMMKNLGYLQVTEIKEETIIAKVGRVYREIFRGAELYEYTPDQDELVLKRSEAAQQGFLIAIRDEKVILGTNDVVYIDLGSDHGVASGNLLYISRPRKVSSEIHKKAGDVDLPDEVLGAAVVIEARNQTSSAVIIKSVDAMYIGDQVTMVTD